MKFYWTIIAWFFSQKMNKSNFGQKKDNIAQGITRGVERGGVVYPPKPVLGRRWGNSQKRGVVMNTSWALSGIRQLLLPPNTHTHTHTHTHSDTQHTHQQAFMAVLVEESSGDFQLQTRIMEFVSSICSTGNQCVCTCTTTLDMDTKKYF